MNTKGEAMRDYRITLSPKETSIVIACLGKEIKKAKCHRPDSVNFLSLIEDKFRITQYPVLNFSEINVVSKIIGEKLDKARMRYALTRKSESQMLLLKDIQNQLTECRLFDICLRLSKSSYL